jgi:REP element-mobilizing transposase RayT
MADSYTNLLYHLVFSTKDRRPLITPVHEVRLYEYIGGIVRELGGISLEINGSEDHVHLLAKLRPDKALSDVLRDLKANATGWMHDVFPSLKDFCWQRGYGAFTDWIFGLGLTPQAYAIACFAGSHANPIPFATFHFHRCSIRIALL